MSEIWIRISQVRRGTRGDAHAVNISQASGGTPGDAHAVNRLAHRVAFLFLVCRILI